MNTKISFDIYFTGRTNSVADKIYKNIDNDIVKIANKAHVAVVYIVAPSFAFSAILESIYRHLTSNSSDSLKKIVPAT